MLRNSMCVKIGFLLDFTDLMLLGMKATQALLTSIFNLTLC